MLEALLATMRSEGLLGETVKVHVGHVASGPLVGSSAEFKALLAKHNRNYLALDMESAGIARTAHNHPDRPFTIIVRGISDPSDERKELLDEKTGDAVRQWALQNALRLFHLLLKASEAPWLRVVPAPGESGADLQTHSDAVHDAIRMRYLSPPYRNTSFLDQAPFETYARLFDRIAELRYIEPTGNLFETVIRGTESTSSDTALQVEGPAGSGKTSFLNVLYWWLRREHTADPAAALPVYINLHTYNSLPTESRGAGRGETAVTARLQSDLAPLRAVIENFPQQPIVLIVDGDDEYARHQKVITANLLDFLAPCTYKRIIGLRTLPAEARRRNESAKRSVFLRSLAPDEPELQEFIADFCDVVEGADSENLKAHVRAAVAQSHLPELDFFTLTLLSASDRQQIGRNLAMLLRDYCRDYVDQRSASENADTLLVRAAETAFNQEIRREDAPAGGSSTALVSELINLHPRVRDYLVAQHVINEMLKMSAEGVLPRDVLNHVYPYRINRLCKELISGNARDQERMLTAIHKVLQALGTPGLARAHACYLAGRVDTRQARAEALDILKQHRRDLASAPKPVYENEEQERVDLLVVRTIAISMAYLGDRTAGADYVRKLLSDPRQDRLNRGFHLDYYGDQELSQTANNLVSDDEGGACPRTFEQLRNRLLSDRSNPIYEIELQTLSSLAQHRHARGVLQAADADRVAEVITTALRSQRVKIPELRRYLMMVREHLGSRDFRVAQIYDTFHRIKEVRRSGWAVRGIADGESVADHTYCAYLLGVLFLPQRWKSERYSRAVVLEILLWHDLAEAVTGDILPWKRTEESDSREREVYNKLSMVGTYEGVPNLEYVRKYMQDFRGESTFNARVAHDLDRLENLVQLWVYRIQGQVIPGADEWETEIREDISTDLGLHILERLKEYYIPRIEDPSKPIAAAPAPPELDPRFSRVEGGMP